MPTLLSILATSPLLVEQFCCQGLLVSFCIQYIEFGSRFSVCYLLIFCTFPELYQQMLAKALAHYFNAKLLLLDVTDFSLKVCE